MSGFTAKYAGNTCGAGDPIVPGDQVEYLDPAWPWETDRPHVPDALWHKACAGAVLRDALCPFCRLLHRDHGGCLL